MRALGLVLAVSLTGCALNSSELERWTRHWEQELETPEHKLSFIHSKDPEFCGANMRTVPPGFLQHEIIYDRGCWWDSEKRLALHEVCHTRLRHDAVVIHPDPEIDYREKEREVEMCEWVYLPEEARRERR